jgi:hypothetical protein
VTTLAGSAGKYGGADGVGASATFGDPSAMAYGAGQLYVVDGNSAIRKVDVSSGAVSTIAAAPKTLGPDDVTGAPRFTRVLSIVYDKAGFLYWVVNERFASGAKTSIRRFDLATGVVANVSQKGAIEPQWSLSTAGEPARLGALASGRMGSLYLSSGGEISEVALANAALTAIAGSSVTAGSADGAGPRASFRGPTGMGAPRSGGDDDGAWTKARFASPEGLAYDGAGHLYVANGAGHTIRAIKVATAAVTTIAGVAGETGVTFGPLPARLNHASGLALGPGPTLFVSDPVENVILEVR